MTAKNIAPKMIQYAIHVKEHINPGWEWLDGWSVAYALSGDTILSGSCVDQAALYGLLARIRDLNLTLISVNRVVPEDEK